ncbi:MAG TPA: hypothetical protein VGJ92_13870 [Methanocella sp.]|jgi:hypothetical protein
MFQKVDDALLEKLREGLAKYAKKDEIILGVEPQRKKFVSLVCVSFALDDTGAGGITGTRFEEVTDTFAADGACTKFKLTRPPVRTLIAVESPAGKPMAEITDYGFDIAKATVMFRKAPATAKEGVRVRYDIPKAVSEVRSLRFAMTYKVLVKSPGVREREDMTVEVVKTFQQAKDQLRKLGIEDLHLVKGYCDLNPEDPKCDIWTVEYEVQAKLDIETLIGPMGKVDVQRMER